MLEMPVDVRLKPVGVVHGFWANTHVWIDDMPGVGHSGIVLLCKGPIPWSWSPHSIDLKRAPGL